MKLLTRSFNGKSINSAIKNKIDKMLSPTFGMCQEIGYMKRSSVDPYLITIGAELTGVHHLLNRPDPGKGGYHIGGMGYFHNEAMIKTLAESCERYSQLLSEYTLKDRNREFLSYEEMKEKYSSVIDECYLRIFTKDQYESSHFPFDPFNPNQQMQWIEMPSLDGTYTSWVPSQMLFVGYTCIKGHEPWISTAVTTGTAAHCTQEKAILSAISELIQIDAAMGHWYTDFRATLLELDDRVQNFNRFFSATFNTSLMTKPKFYYLDSIGLPGFNIACVFEKPLGGVPRFSVGLGSDWNLERAIYKAYLEGAGVIQLARLNIFKEQMEGNRPENGMYNLDSNVAFYGMGRNEEYFLQKFPSGVGVKTSQIAKDLDSTNEIKTIQMLCELFKQNQMELYYVDLTTPESRELGFHIARAWSPQLLPLSLPSAPNKGHKRFKAYSEKINEYPHPYP